MKTLILNPTKPPFTNTISMERAVQWNMESSGRNLSLMFAALLEELVEEGCLFYGNIGRILDMEVTGVEDTNKIPPFEEIP